MPCRAARHARATLYAGAVGLTCLAWRLAAPTCLVAPPCGGAAWAAALEATAGLPGGCEAGGTPPQAAVGRRSVLVGAASSGARASFATGVIAGAAAALPAEDARAEVPRVLAEAFKYYGDGLQLAGDELVFDVRPWIVNKDWDQLRSMLKADSYGNSKLWVTLVNPIDRLVIGNEDFLEGTDTLSLKLARTLRVANATAWGDESVRQERLLSQWDDMAAIVSKVMTECNKLFLEEQSEFASRQPYVLPVADPASYNRSFKAYDSRCKGVMTSGICGPGVPLPRLPR